MDKVSTGSTGRRRKGDKTEAILRFLEAHPVSDAGALSRNTDLTAKEVSSRLSMLQAQGRIERFRNEDGASQVRFVSREIVNRCARSIRPQNGAEPAMLEQFAKLEQLWQPRAAKELRALTAAVTASNAARKAPVLEAATPFVQVVMQAHAQGRVRVYTHCLIDGPDEDGENEGRRSTTPLASAAPERAEPAVVPITVSPVGMTLPLPFLDEMPEVTGARVRVQRTRAVAAQVRA